MSFRITLGLLGVQMDTQTGGQKASGRIRINDEVLGKMEHELNLTETRLSLM